MSDGDWIDLDVEARTLTVDVSEAELARRRQAWSVPPQRHGRGYLRLFSDHVMQANTGADFDFLRGSSGSAVPRQSF